MTSTEKIKAVQKFSGLTQQDIANKIGVTFVALNRWLRGKSIPRKSAQEIIDRMYCEYFDKYNNTESREEAYLYEQILTENFDVLGVKIFSEQVLKNVAQKLNLLKFNGELAYKLITGIPKQTRFYDWNVGSTLQHFDSTIIFESFKRIDNYAPYYNSMGLAWVFGELNSKDSTTIEYLYSVVNFSNNSDAWWRAAFSLEKLGIEEAVNLLKRSQKTQPLKSLNHYFENISDKRSTISILTLSNVDNVENIIYPRIKEIFLNSNHVQTLINCCWLIGRFNLIDDKIIKKLVKFINHKNYELRYYTFFALQSNTSEALRPVLEKSMEDRDSLIRKMACRALRSLGNERSLSVLERALYVETDTSVISELTKAIYYIKNPLDKNRFLIEQRSYKNENGLIIDESDKWYKDAAIYNVFSEAEDPQNVCFDLIKELLKNHKIVNPVDLATGTGRMLWQITDKLTFTGSLFGVDASKDMCEFLEKNLKRERKYTHDIKIVKSVIEDFPSKFKKKSSLVVSSFGFPSKISNKELCIKELKAVYSILSEDGLFITLGWDETFNDELNAVWFKYIPDNIQAKNFEEWRRKRASSISSARNCNLTWFKKGIHVPLQFSSIKESAMVMGYLFGRDAAQNAIQNNKVEWMMSMGITYNTKQDIKKIINEYEKRD